MKYLLHNRVSAVCLLFGMIIPAAPILWELYRPEIQSALRAAQNAIMRILG